MFEPRTLRKNLNCQYVKWQCLTHAGRRARVTWTHPLSPVASWEQPSKYPIAKVNNYDTYFQRHLKIAFGIAGHAKTKRKTKKQTAQKTSGEHVSDDQNEGPGAWAAPGILRRLHKQKYFAMLPNILVCLSAEECHAPPWTQGSHSGRQRHAHRTCPGRICFLFVLFCVARPVMQKMIFE